MPGRKTFTRAELERARNVIGSQLEAYRELARAARGADGDVQPALAEFEHLFFNTLALALDRPFVHRLPSVTGRSSTPLDELSLICESLLTGGGVFRAGTVVGYDPATSVSGLAEGDHVRLTAEGFGRLFDGVLAELEQKFAEDPSPGAH